MADKQACLIIAHRNNAVFRTLIQMLDHPQNDIFIHMDVKTKSYNPADTESLVKHSRVIHTPRVKVSWGSFSIVEATLRLLEAATSQGKYEHYHLISGQDLPIKTQDEIITFFEEHHGVEFVGFQSDTLDLKHGERVRYYYPFQDIKGGKIDLIVKLIDKLALTLQKIFHVYRNKGINFQKGSQWFSITDEFARYILSKREWICKVFHDTWIPDELFVQTLATNSSFAGKLFHGNEYSQSMRLIDWKRGTPYTFRMSDLEEIKKSPAMFARKFDEAVDIEIIHKIRELYSG